ncbi:MAG: hypothetical protein WCJ97_02680 [Phycisphaerae bacterium]
MQRRIMSVPLVVIGLAMLLLISLIGSRFALGQVSAIPKPKLAFVDLAVKGEVGIPGAGEVLSELMLTEFPGKRYQPVEKSKFTALLKEQGLTTAEVRDTPDKAYAKLKDGVSYLVVGSISKLKSYTLTARVVEVATGNIVQSVEMTAETVEDLQDCTAEAAKILEMTPDEKKAYLDEKQFAAVLEEARKKVTEKDFEGAVILYRRCLVIRYDVIVVAELRKVRLEIDRAFRLFCGKLTIVVVANTEYGYDCRIRDAIKEVTRRNGGTVTADIGKAKSNEQDIWVGVQTGKHSETSAIVRKLNAHMIIWVQPDTINSVEVRVIATDNGEEIMSRTFDTSNVAAPSKTGQLLVNHDAPVFGQVLHSVIRAWQQHIAVK